MPVLFSQLRSKRERTSLSKIPLISSLIWSIDLSIPNTPWTIKSGELPSAIPLHDRDYASVLGLDSGPSGWFTDNMSQISSKSQCSHRREVWCTTITIRQSLFHPSCLDTALILLPWSRNSLSRTTKNTNSAWHQAPYLTLSKSRTYQLVLCVTWK